MMAKMDKNAMALSRETGREREREVVEWKILFNKDDEQSVKVMLVNTLVHY
jgi:hypothetical protein